MRLSKVSKLLGGIATSYSVVEFVVAWPSLRNGMQTPSHASVWLSVQTAAAVTYTGCCRSQTAAAVVPELHSSSAEHAWSAGAACNLRPPGL